jgi:hypothetical protein
MRSNMPSALRASTTASAPARILAARSTSTTASSLVNTAAPIRSMDD